MPERRPAGTNVQTTNPSASQYSTWTTQSHASAALDAVVDLAFGELPMYRLTAETHTDNAPALAVLAKSGFTPEGISRAACLHRGRGHDLAVFSLLRPEWEELKRPRAWDV
ncbi:GNAT family N-acetyltransferase [Streptomyces sp. NPDC056367]|uniref:GNAT family N-acetyltransferase n=1 Tax=Streptomyces sp. NPDC056367 TaxID=3345797 RepID=UPI0035D8C5CC